MIEVRFHGRGGQGAVTSVEMIALAAISEGKYALAFPSFGPERRGAPVLAFVRIDDKPIKIRSEVKEPDIVVVFDPRLLGIIDVASGLKESGVIIVNSKRTPQQIKSILGGKYRVATVDATAIAKEILGVAVVNTTMLGAVVKATDIVRLTSLEEPLKHRFGKGGTRNIDASRKAYEQTLIA